MCGSCPINKIRHVSLSDHTHKNLICVSTLSRLGELVKENRNGMMFEDSAQLLQILLTLLKRPRNKLSMMRSYLERQKSQFIWDLEWNRSVGSLFK